MPKKTKREKLLAQQRREWKFQLGHTQTSETASDEILTQKTNPFQKHESFVSPEEKITRSYFFIDLRKSLIFISFVIALEFFFYFVSIKNNFLR